VILLSHPTANQNVRQTALAFAEADLLEEFWTGVSWNENGVFDRLAAFFPRLRNELRRRSFPAELAPFVRTVPGREWGRLADDFGLTQDEIARRMGRARPSITNTLRLLELVGCRRGRRPLPSRRWRRSPPGDR